MGVNSSGVRQIAAAVGAGNSEQVAPDDGRAAPNLDRARRARCPFSSVASRQVSTVTFGNRQQTAAVCLLSVAVFFNWYLGAKNALIQGMRRIADLAKIQVLGAFFGMVCSVVLVYIWRDKGVVPSPSMCRSHVPGCIVVV